MCTNPTDNASFEEIFEEVSWELCREAASMAVTDFSYVICANIERPDVEARRAKTLEEGVEMLMQTQNGGLRIAGTWKAGGKRGDLTLTYVRLLSPTAANTFIVRFLDESIRLKIAKELMRIKIPDVDLPDTA